MSRVDEELALLRVRFPDLEYRPEGQWIRLPEYKVPAEVWVPAVVQIAFQIPPAVATAPYAFHARALAGESAELRLAGDAAILNTTQPTTTPWGSDWTTFSWQLEAWEPATPIEAGTTMLQFARSIASRFAEGA